MYGRIVVPLDGSELAERALSQASDLARLANAPIHLVRIVDYTQLEISGAYALAMAYSPVEPLLTQELEAAAAYLGGVKSCLVGEGLAVDTEVRQGRVARELVALAQPEDIFVIASHGRGGFTRWLLGSVAEDLVRHSSVPILLVRAGVVPHKAETAELVGANASAEKR
jgi:nucleotide-binding universal stress UspA family protein